MSKKDFSVALKYVEARPRSQRRRGAEARVSGISVGGSGVSATDLSLLQANLISVTNNFTALKDLFDSMFEKDSEGNIHAKLSLWSSGGITAGGVGSGGSGGGGTSYNRLDSWADYSADKAGYVLSALLGKDLDNRVSALANAGYITQSALAPYALRSEIPSLVGYATQSWVGENYLSKSGGKLVYSGAQGLEAERTDGAPSHIMFIGVVNGTSRQLGGFGMNGYNDPVYVNPNGIRHKVLTAENYTALLAGYATESWVGGNYLSKSGGVITGQGDYAYVQLRLSGDIATIGFQQYGVDKGVVGWLGNTGIRLQNLNGYGLAVRDSNDPIYYWGENGSVQRILLHAGNYSSYALPITGGTIYGGIGALKIKSSGTGNSYIEYQNNTETLGYIGFRAKGAPAYMDDATYIQYDLLHLYNYRDYVVATNGNSTVNGSITATSFIGNLTGNAGSATYILTKLTRGDAFYPDKYKAYIQWVSEDTAVMKFTDGDYQFRANSATKLATPRTIWGQSFDGTQNVAGNLTNVNRIRFSEAGAQILVRGSNYSSGMTDNDIGIFATMTAFSGNVAIGGATADEKLHVYGNGKFTGALTANSLTIGGATITYDSVNEALCINGNMYALGGITAGAAGISTYSSLEARVARLEQQLNIS